MPTTDERVASLEARMDRIDDLFTLIGELRSDVNRQFGDIRREMGGLRGEMATLRSEMNQRFMAVDNKVDRDFRTLISVQVAILLAVVSALMGAYFR